MFNENLFYSFLLIYNIESRAKIVFSQLKKEMCMPRSVHLIIVEFVEDDNILEVHVGCVEGVHVLNGPVEREAHWQIVRVLLAEVSAAVRHTVERFVVSQAIVWGDHHE